MPQNIQHNLPHAFICPLTRKPFVDPVVAPDGYSYERQAFDRWQKDHGERISPKTLQDMQPVVALPNRVLARTMHDFFRQRLPGVLEARRDDWLENLECPISHEVMKQPVRLSSGVDYERDSAVAWLRDNPVCPMTRERLTAAERRAVMLQPSSLLADRAMHALARELAGVGPRSAQEARQAMRDGRRAAPDAVGAADGLRLAAGNLREDAAELRRTADEIVVQAVGEAAHPREIGGFLQGAVQRLRQPVDVEQWVIDIGTTLDRPNVGLYDVLVQVMEASVNDPFAVAAALRRHHDAALQVYNGQARRVERWHSLPMAVACGALIGLPNVVRGRDFDRADAALRRVEIIQNAMRNTDRFYMLDVRSAERSIRQGRSLADDDLQSLSFLPVWVPFGAISMLRATGHMLPEETEPSAAALWTTALVGAYGLSTCLYSLCVFNNRLSSPLRMLPTPGENPRYVPWLHGAPGARQALKGLARLAVCGMMTGVFHSVATQFWGHASYVPWLCASVGGLSQIAVVAA